MTEKIIGYLLLGIGLLFIVYSAFDSYQVFTKQKQPIQLFTFSGISLDVTQALSAGLPKELTQTGFSLPPQKQQIISADMINIPMNLFAELLLMGFMASIGARLATIGTQLIRPIVVKLHEESSAHAKESAK